MDYETIEYSETGNVATITLNQPQRRNAINEMMSEELVRCINYCDEDDNIRAVILTGRGKAFCSGGDLGAEDFFADSPQLRVKRLLNAAYSALFEIRRVSKPVIAAVNGPAVGGGFALALACDLIIAAESANFNSHYVRIGMSPDAGMSWFLPRLVGDKRATWLMFTGEVVDAQKGYEMGFVNQVVDDDRLLHEARSFAKKLASSATLAIARTKELINRSWQESLESQMENEKQAIARLGHTEDVQEAITAFRDKRKPRFKGR